MFRTNLLSGIFLVSILLSACSHATQPAQPLPTPSGDWTVKLTQSGGIAGMLLTVEVSSDGQLQAQDSRTNRSVTATLPDETIARLTQLISETTVSRAAAPSSSCADCFIYLLEIHSTVKDLQIKLDDVTIGDSGAGDLIAYLRVLRDNALRNP